ncbi:hypothetical protein A4G99_15465 [Haladaptatus sp. R4]|nr:hypothetical protein A4G99_15465 [Haladaptatus sp. R4]
MTDGLVRRTYDERERLLRTKSVKRPTRDAQWKCQSRGVQTDYDEDFVLRNGMESERTEDWGRFTGPRVSNGSSRLRSHGRKCSLRKRVSL